MKKSLTLTSLLALAQAAFATTIVNIADYGAKPDGTDSTPAIIKAIDAIKKIDDDVVLKFPKGQYEISSNYAHEKYCFISNNDEGLKPIVFDLEDAKNLTIDGQGSAFVMHGYLHPFMLKNAKNITLKNFSLDSKRPFHHEAKILEADGKKAILEFSDEYPFVVSGGAIKFNAPQDPLVFPLEVSKKFLGYKRLLEFNPQRRETSYLAKDYYPHATFKKIGKNKVEMNLLTPMRMTAGNILTFDPDSREYPGFSITKSENVVFDNITIHTSLGMGIIAQNSKDIVVKNSKVTPSKGRTVSCIADATHFVNCTGKITLENNLFENQYDDATNIHGIYEKIVSIDGDTFVSRLVHRHQYGFETFEVGQKVEFIDEQSMVNVGEGVIKSVERINKQAKRITLEKPLPSTVKVNDAVAVIRDYPDVLIKNNIIRGNRARGMLINCRGKTLIEDNIFSTSGTSILFESDAIHWFEQGGTRDCTIRNNVFDNCKYAIWGDGIIGVGAGILKDKETSRYNKNITIENNTFKIFDNTPILSMYCVDGLKWRNNKIIKTSEYPAREGLEEKPFVIEHCDNIDIQEN